MHLMHRQFNFVSVDVVRGKSAEEIDDSYAILCKEERITLKTSTLLTNLNALSTRG